MLWVRLFLEPVVVKHGAFFHELFHFMVGQHDVDGAGIGVGDFIDVEMIDQKDPVNIPMIPHSAIPMVSTAITFMPHMAVTSTVKYGITFTHSTAGICCGAMVS